jgi:hypothetical protein
MSIHFRLSINCALAVWLALVSAVSAFGLNYLGEPGLMGYIIAHLVARPLVLLISKSVSDRCLRVQLNHCGKALLVALHIKGILTPDGVALAAVQHSDTRMGTLP